MVPTYSTHTTTPRYSTHTQPPHPTSHTEQGTESSAASLQPSVRPHLEPYPGPSLDQHGIETTPVTQHHIPAGPHSQRSVSGQSSPPLQSSPRSQSSAQMTTTTTTTTDLPRPECGDAVAHQSRQCDQQTHK